MTVYDHNLVSWYRDLFFGKYTLGARRAARIRTPEPVARWHAEARPAPCGTGHFTREAPHQVALPKG